MTLQSVVGLACLTLLVVGPASPGLNGQSILGRVLDAETGAAVGGAEVALLPGEELSNVTSRGIADDKGAFLLDDLAPGRYRLRVSRLGYREVTTPPFDLAEGEQLPVEVHASVRAVPLAPLTILTSRPPRLSTARLIRTGFVDRMEAWGAEGLGMGHFLEPEDLDRRMAARVTDLLRDLPGVRVQGGGGREQYVTMRSGTNLFRGRCMPVIYLDGVVLRPEDNPTIDVMISAWSVSAIEIYPGINKPAEFGHMSGTPCGAIVIWTGAR